MFSYESERIVVVVSGFDDDADSVARRGEETVREPRAKSSANGKSSSFTFSFSSLCLTRGCLGKLSDSARKFFLNTGGTAVTSVSIGNFRTAETRENAV